MKLFNKPDLRTELEARADREALKWRISNWAINIILTASFLLIAILPHLMCRVDHGG